MSITVESFTLEDDSSIAMATNVTNLFVEYSFLNFEYGELETPTSLPKPPPREATLYNFRKGTLGYSKHSRLLAGHCVLMSGQLLKSLFTAEFCLDSEQERLLTNMLKRGDPSEGR